MLLKHELVDNKQPVEEQLIDQEEEEDDENLFKVKEEEEDEDEEPMPDRRKRGIQKVKSVHDDDDNLTDEQRSQLM